MGIAQNKSGRVSVKTRLRNTLNGQPRNSSCTINLEYDSESSVKKEEILNELNSVKDNKREKQS